MSLDEQLVMIAELVRDNFGAEGVSIVVEDPVQAGTFEPGFHYGTMADGMVDIAPFGDSVDADTAALIEERKAEIIAGTFSVLPDPIVDQDGNEPAPMHTELQRLWATLQLRAQTRPPDSYTVRLLDDTNLRVKKLGEETTELVVALTNEDRPAIAEEAADLIYHVMTALLGAGVEWSEVEAVLADRRT